MKTEETNIKKYRKIDNVINEIRDDHVNETIHMLIVKHTYEACEGY